MNAGRPQEKRAMEEKSPAKVDLHIYNGGRIAQLLSDAPELTQQGALADPANPIYVEDGISGHIRL